MSCCCCSKVHHSRNRFKKKVLEVDEEKSSPSLASTAQIPSFFKIMLGDFAEAMVVPPKHARTLEAMVGGNVCLEDSDGDRWTVKLSAANGSLAFEEGWHDFVLQHSISSGEIVVFKHIGIPVFSVQVFSTSGSERLHFRREGNSVNNHRRKRRKKENLPDILCLGEARKDYAASKKVDMQRKVISNNRKGERIEKETSTDILCLKKAQERCEAKGKCRKYDQDPSKKYGVEKSSPRDLDADEMSEWSSLILLSEDDEDTDTTMISKRHKKKLKKKSAEHATNGEGTLRAHDTLHGHCSRVARRKSLMAHEDAVQNDEGVGKMVPVNPVTHEKIQKKKYPDDANTSMMNRRNAAQHGKAMAVEHVENKEGNAEACDNVLATEKEVTQITPINLLQLETFQRERSITDRNILEVNEELFNDNHSNLKIPTPTSAANCSKHGIESYDAATQLQNTITKDWLKIGKFSSDNESPHEKSFNKFDDTEIVGHNYDVPECTTPKCIENGGQNLIVPKGFARRSLSYAAEENLKQKLEGGRDDLISLSAAIGDCNILFVDADGVIRRSLSPTENFPCVPSNAQILNCDPQPVSSEANLGSYVAPSKARPAKIEVEHFRSANAGKVTPSPEQVLRVVKTEKSDSAHVTPPNHNEFGITVSLSSQSWLLLPEKLPACLFRKKCRNNVALLQDPSMKLWPVLYHDGPDFIGFVDGWEDFTVANNLQQGDTCQIVSVSASESTSEPILKVEMLKVQNLN